MCVLLSERLTFPGRPHFLVDNLQFVYQPGLGFLALYLVDVISGIGNSQGKLRRSRISDPDIRPGYQTWISDNARFCPWQRVGGLDKDRAYCQNPTEKLRKWRKKR